MPEHPPSDDGADPTVDHAYRTVLDDLARVAPTATSLRRDLDRCPTFVDGQLVLVLLCLAEDDVVGAGERLAGVVGRRATMTRRQRQLTELVTLAVAGRRYRFHTLATEHRAEHPDDHPLLTAAEIALARASRTTP
jgi:hypothetical protein